MIDDSNSEGDIDVPAGGGGLANADCSAAVVDTHCWNLSDGPGCSA